MRKMFYPKLAVSGIYKNRKIYLPYLFTCIGMVMMYYIIQYLTRSESVASMRGGSEMQMILGFGTGIIAVFALIFLFYTNSFLIRRRKKEFGLYNILGMGKWNLFRVLFWESMFAAGVSLVFGLFCGILFSKIAELCMAKILEAEITYIFTVEWGVVFSTVLLFLVIFGLILLNSVRQIYIAKPIELMHSESFGEKPPKANWLGAVIGAVLLGAAYYLAVVIKDPLSAMLWFFVAVILVILGTYLLFIAGSVVFCRLLQKRRGYYYKTNHFVSVSSMVFRMKRNGAGLASICILSTMVLVMISSTACLFLGAESSWKNRYPREIVLDTYSMEETYAESVRNAARQVLGEHGMLAENILHYRFLSVGGYVEENRVIFDIDELEGFSMSGYQNVKQFFFLPVSDYNQLMGEEKTLAEGEVLLYSGRSEFPYDSLQIQGCAPMQVKEKVSEFVENGTSAMQVVSSYYVFVPDFETIMKIFDVQAEIYQDNSSDLHDYYGFDLNCSNEEQIVIANEISQRLSQLQTEAGAFPEVSVESRAVERNGFYSLYGGMFFLGILLGLVFIFAAVLIIYYKQISEGYEDQSRFGIMRKVGMTKREIKRSVNSQVLMVFFLPLLMAGLHLLFAFPIVTRLLLIFGLSDTLLLAEVTAGCYILFALFYVLVYRITSRAYYHIVIF